MYNPIQFLGKRRLPPSAVILEKPRELDAHFDEVFGAPKASAAPSKDWRPFYPKHEIQSYGDCVTFSYLNCVETQTKEKNLVDDNGEELNLSDLDLAVGSGTSQNGNSLDNVAERARKTGVVLERLCPYTKVWNERTVRVSSIPKDAKRYLKGTGHTWVKPDLSNMKAALEKGPLQIAVGLGETYQNNGVITPSSRIEVYHAMEMGYIDELGQKYCYDHYNRQQVTLSSDYGIEYTKLILPEGLPDGWRSNNVDSIKLYKRLIGKIIIRPESRGECYRVNVDELVKINFVITDNELFRQVQECLREKSVFVGVSEVDFKKILEALELFKGRIVDNTNDGVGLWDLVKKIKL